MTPNELATLQEKVFSQNTNLTEQQEIIYSLLDSKDIVNIKGKTYINKRGYRKIALYLNISTEVIQEIRIKEDDVLIYDFTVRAITALGRYVEASASCASNERDFSHLENDVRATSQTRATNRAISDLIGIWEIENPNFGPVQEDKKSPSHGPENTPEANAIPITAKQRSYLIRLIEERYEDEATRASLFMQIDSMSKSEATKAISDMLSNGEF